jgi:molecular chaperone Hsp33
MTQRPEIFADRLLGFSIPSRHARGRAVRLDRSLGEILSAHAYPPAITHLLAEALVLATLIGGLLKNDGAQLTMQAQTEGGVVRLLVCDWRAGELRGYVDFDAERLAALGANPSLFALFGKGYLAITFDIDEGSGRYQGIVPLEGESLAQACENYFSQSEQLPTLIRTAVRSTAGGTIAAGLVIQHLAEGEVGRERLHVRMDHPEWEHVAILAGSTRHEELLDPELSLEALVWRLFHEEEQVRVDPGASVTRGCRCSDEHYRSIIAQFPEDEREAMRNDQGLIVVDCAFCSREFPIRD